MTTNKRILIALGLTLLTIAAFEGVRHCGFIYDDTMFITNNPYVHKGLSSESIRWAMTAYHTGNWHPLTWITHFADYSMFGLDPTGHHVVNLLIHIVNTLLLFSILTRATRSVWPGVIVAALFAVHPLRVESVAWVSERKDVLGGLFWMLTIAAYLRYVDRPGKARYVLVAAAFMLGLMCKPMIVTLPFVLLLLDFWPLKRLNPSWLAQKVDDSPGVNVRKASSRGRTRSPKALIVEKIPLIAMVIAVIGVTLAAQRSEGGLAMMQTGELSWGVRLGNAAVSYVTYLAKTVYPAGLAVFYPHPKENLSIPMVVLSLALLFLFSVMVVVAARRGARYALTGWLWYLGVLVPVIGVVQTGAYAMADRYSYLPSIGFFIVVVFGFAHFCEKRPTLRQPIGVATFAVLIALVATTRHQVGYWRNGTTLYTHAIEVTENNHVAYYNLSRIELLEGNLDGAIRHLEETLRLVPTNVDARNNLGIALSSKGRHEEAIRHLKVAVETDPESSRANNNLGQALAMAGKLDEAGLYFERAVQLQPDFAKAHYNIAYVRSTQGRFDEALQHCEMALRLKPDLAAAIQLRTALIRQRDEGEPSQ